MSWLTNQFINPIKILGLILLLLIGLIFFTHYQIIPINDQLVNQLITVASMISGLLLIIWQIGKQHTNSLKLQEDALKQKIKLDVFSELDKTLSECQESLINIGTTILLLPSKFSTQIHMVSTFSNMIPNYQPVPMRERVQDIVNDHSQAIKNLISVIYVLEKYEIIFPDNSIKPIIGKFQKCIDEVGNTIKELNILLGKYLPIDIPEDKSKELGKVYTPPLPNSEQLKAIETLAKEYNKNERSLLGFIYDIRIESQNLLLGPLFNRKLPPRQPTDASIEVIKFPDNCTNSTNDIRATTIRGLNSPIPLSSNKKLITQ